MATFISNLGFTAEARSMSHTLLDISFCRCVLRIQVVNLYNFILHEILRINYYLDNVNV